MSLTRAKRTEEAVAAYERLFQFDETTDQDRMDYAAALIRKSEWGQAKEQLSLVPPTVETFQRYRLEDGILCRSSTAHGGAAQGASVRGLRRSDTGAAGGGDIPGPGTRLPEHPGRFLPSQA